MINADAHPCLVHQTVDKKVESVSELKGAFCIDMSRLGAGDVPLVPDPMIAPRPALPSAHLETVC